MVFLLSASCAVLMGMVSLWDCRSWGSRGMKPPYSTRHIDTKLKRVGMLNIQISRSRGERLEEGSRKVRLRKPGDVGLRCRFWRTYRDVPYNCADDIRGRPDSMYRTLL